MSECSVRILPPPAIALVMARKGQAATAHAAAAQAFGAALPSQPRIVYGNEVALVWCGPERWLVLMPGERATASGGIEALLEPVFPNTASVADQSGSRVLIEVAGSKAREILARSLPVDLHPRAFGPGHTALCRANDVSLQIWQSGPEPAFVLAVPRSHAEGFHHTLLGTAASLCGGEA